MQKAIALAHQIGRVGMSSLVALCVDVSVFLAVLPLVPFAALAAVMGHASGIAAHYLVSSRFTLKAELSHVKGMKAQADALSRFFVAGGTGMAVTTLIVFLTVDHLGLNPLVGKGLAIGASFFTVFLMLRLLVLREPQQPHSLQSAEH
jgi:putative flippase GtrA